MSETQLVRGIVQALQLRGIFCWRVNAGSIHRDGVHYRGAPAGSPDIMGVLPDRSGRLFGIECKAKDGTIRASQRRWSAKALQHGVFYGVARSIGEGLALVANWNSEGKRANAKESR